MSTLISSLLLISLTFSAMPAKATTLDKLGERLSKCQNLAQDDYIVRYHNAFKRQVKNQFEDNKLKTAIVPNLECFRVGTEIQLYLENDQVPYLGRALIQEIKVLNRSELKKEKNLGFSKSSVNDFLADERASSYSFLTFKVTEKIEEEIVTEKYKRLKTCFPAYGDWESLRTTDARLVKDIQAGRTQALIFNGTLNCYKVGVYTSIDLRSERQQRPEKLGYIIPTEVRIVHYSNLDREHASLLDEKLSDLKKRLAENKDRDGGYLNMVVFDYEKVHPKELERTE